MSREKLKWRPHESESTDARHRGGAACSSDEVSVMGMGEGAASSGFIEWSTRDGRSH